MVIERGMTAALAADLGAAEKAVAEAELLGTSAGETRLLRGFIALLRWAGRRSSGAYLEQAVQLMPESVSARALLADAHVGTGDWVAARQVVTEASALTPRTPEDKLFLGHAIGSLVPAQGLPLMDEALTERPSGIGHVLRADVRATLASDTGAVADAEAAVADAEVARRLLPGNPYPIATRPPTRARSRPQLTDTPAAHGPERRSNWPRPIVESDGLAPVPGASRDGRDPVLRRPRPGWALGPPGLTDRVAGTSRCQPHRRRGLPGGLQLVLP